MVIGVQAARSADVSRAKAAAPSHSRDLPRRYTVRGAYGGATSAALRKDRPRSLLASGRSLRASAGRADGVGLAAPSGPARAASNTTMVGLMSNASSDLVAGARPVLAERQAHVHSPGPHARRIGSCAA